jgi:GTP cyclohydrolase I
MNLMTTGDIEFVEDADLAGVQTSYVDGANGSATDGGTNGSIASLTRKLLEALGEDPGREGLRQTPERVARMYGELLAGVGTDPGAAVNGAIFNTDYQGMVLVRDIDFYSLCEHHLLPFFGKAHIAYLADGKVLGLSKLPRIVDLFARRLQIQEQMTQQIAECLWEVLHPRGLAVVVEAAHLCAMMRGVQRSRARMTTSTMLGEFKTDASLRTEFYMKLGQDTGRE